MGKPPNQLLTEKKLKKQRKLKIKVAPKVAPFALKNR